MATKKRTAKQNTILKVPVIDNAGEAWKLYSVWGGAAIAVITAANEWMPGLQGFMSPDTYAKVMAALGVAVIVARIVKQNVDAK